MKMRSRMAAVLLIPGLLLDPAWARGVPAATSPRSLQDVSRFNQDALMEPLLSAHRDMGAFLKARTWIAAGALSLLAPAVADAGPGGLAILAICVAAPLGIMIRAGRPITENAQAGAALQEITEWIGRPSGPAEGPVTLGLLETVNTFEANHQLSQRTLRLVKIQGSGLAGTVYLVEDDQGNRWVEKHYGVAGKGKGKHLGRMASEFIFFFFRQAPLSYRLLPEAAIASHLSNRIITSATREHFKHDPQYEGRDITPPILYTRFDVHTGGYVHAFPYVEGRPLRTWGPGLPLLGEGAIFKGTMELWRDFVAHRLGFWGLARQVDPRNPNARTNLWVTPEGHVGLLDLVPGLPGFTEAGNLFWGLIRGEFAPFGDAIDFRVLRRYLSDHPSMPQDVRESLPLLELSVQRWQASEPRLISSPWRWASLLFNPYVKTRTRLSQLTQLASKGAIAEQKTMDYRARWQTTGKPPSLLNVLMPAIAYAFKQARARAASIARLTLQAGETVIAFFSLLWWLFRIFYKEGWNAALYAFDDWLKHDLPFLRLLWDHDARTGYLQEWVGGWIESERKLGRLKQDQADHLRLKLSSESGITADILDIFVVHSILSVISKFFGGSSLMAVTLWIATGNSAVLLLLAVDPALRLVASLVLGKSLPRQVQVLLASLSLVPVAGNAAALLCLLIFERDLGGFMTRMTGQRLALRIPGLGERGSSTEMFSVAAAQVFIVEQRWVLLFSLLGLLGVFLSQPWLWAPAFSIYVAAVLRSIRTHRQGAPDLKSNFAHSWKFGFPAASVTVPLDTGIEKVMRAAGMIRQQPDGQLTPAYRAYTIAEAKGDAKGMRRALGWIAPKDEHPYVTDAMRDVWDILQHHVGLGTSLDLFAKTVREGKRPEDMNFSDPGMSVPLIHLPPIWIMLRQNFVQAHGPERIGHEPDLEQAFDEMFAAMLDVLIVAMQTGVAGRLLPGKIILRGIVQVIRAHRRYNLSDDVTTGLKSAAMTQQPGKTAQFFLVRGDEPGQPHHLPLSETGRRHMHTLADRLKVQGARVDVILYAAGHQTRETAKILQHQIAPAAPLRSIQSDILQNLNAGQRLLIVGDESTLRTAMRDLRERTMMHEEEVSVLPGEIAGYSFSYGQIEKVPAMALDSRKRLILLVEDTRTELDMYVRELEAEGFDVVTMENGEEALEYLEHTRKANGRFPDAILSDRHLGTGHALGQMVLWNIRTAGFAMPLYIHTKDDEFVGYRVDLPNERLRMRHKSHREDTYRDISHDLAASVAIPQNSGDTPGTRPSIQLSGSA